MKKVISKMNFLLLFLMILYAIFGLVMIFSASSVAAVLRYNVSTNYFFLRQLLFIAIGFAIGFVILFIPTNKYRLFSRIALVLILVLLVFLFVAGKVAGGATSWYKVGILNFQPLEFAKIILIIYFAVYYHRISFKKKITFWNMLKPIIYGVLMCVLIAAQPDFGGAFIVALITFLVFISLPIGKKAKKMIIRIGLIGCIVVVGALLLFGKNVLRSYQINRVLNFLNPCQRYTEDTGYQVCNGYIAIHNGGLWGVGLGNSTQKYLYLPEAHTDFIFPIICEELGLVVGIIVIIGYFVILFILLNIAKETTCLRNSILVYGVFAYLLSHILVNLLGVLGLIPLTGVPLPFLSYGGSYNFCVIISLFIVERVCIENREGKLREKIVNL